MYFERPVEGKPHAGKVLAAIQPHSDDVPILRRTVAKLIDEGYTGYLIRATNDEWRAPGTIGEQRAANERDMDRAGQALGPQRDFGLNYRTITWTACPGGAAAALHLPVPPLKVDTVVCSPLGHYEENPDHYVPRHASRRPAGWRARLGLSRAFAAG